jgi:hypothetical protein
MTFLGAYDSDGNYTGPTSDSTWIENIPGSRYYPPSDSFHAGTIILPAATQDEYRFEVLPPTDGTATTFDLHISEIKDNGLTAVEFQSITLSDGGLAQISLSAVTPTVWLEVDSSGDGDFDSVFSPTRVSAPIRIVTTGGPNGFISPSDTTFVNYRDTVHVAITPDEGYRVLDVLINGESVGAVEEYVLEGVENDISVTAEFALGTSSDRGPAGVREFGMSPNYPNPARDRTTISFSIPEPAHVTLEVFDILGRRVAVVVDEPRPAGEHSVELSLRDYSPGIYTYRIVSGGNKTSRRMVVFR